MTGRLAALLIAASAGALMALQGDFKFGFRKVGGVVGGYLFSSNYGYSAGSGSAAFDWRRQLGEALEAPWYTWLGGVLGVAIIYTVAASIPKVGAASATTAIITAQVLTACIIDHFGLFGLKAVSFTLVQVGGRSAAGCWGMVHPPLTKCSGLGNAYGRTAPMAIS